MTKFDIQYSAIRKAIIERKFASLNEMQRRAVMQTEGPLLILAGAGSGKTTVLINRIINILRFGKESDFAPQNATEEDLRFLMDYLNNPLEENREKAEKLCAIEPAKPWEVIAITFTNKAARELKERLTRAIGERDSMAVWAYTFHTACLRILRRDIEKIGYKDNFTIYDEDDKKRVITDILKQLNMDDKAFDPKAMMNEISRAKDNLISARLYAVQAAGDYYKGKVSDVYTLYQKKMKEANALDFDDIIMKTVELLRNNQDIREYYQQKFRYVLVDEYQDTNHAQYVLTSLLAGGKNNLCVVGDDDQSIYKFRGATIANILEFEQQYPEAKTIRLEQNYRSTDTILCAANEIIRNNLNRKGKELWTDNSGGNKIKLHRSDTQEGEASYIAECIVEGVEKGMKWSDFAVLYRNNALSNSLEGAFRRNSIPYRIYKGRDFFSRAEIRDMFAYLWVIENPSDTLRLKRIVNVPARKIGDRSIELAEDEAARNGISLYEVLQNAKNYQSISRSSNAMLKFIEIIEDLRDKRDVLTLPELYDEMLDKTCYAEMLENKGDIESQNRLDNIMELKSTIIEYSENSENPSLSGFLEDMALYTDADKTSEDEDAVLMMTMHSAKGLEFPVVFLSGMEEGLFPSFRSTENDELLEEERRLCYVAVTRAKNQLHITCTERRMLYGRTQYARPSRFLEEIPENLIDSNISKRQQMQQAMIDKQESDYKQKNANVIAQAYKTAAYIEKKAASIPLTSAQTSLFNVGDRVKHRAFGEGLITSSKPMGGDFLLEIAFDTKGTKRLLSKSASQFMTKI